jgi:hypothetical protein
VACILLGRGAVGLVVHYLGEVCLLLGSGSDFCRDQLTWNFRLPILFYCFRGVCGNYSGVVRLPVKMYKRVKYGNVYKFNSYCYEWCLSTTYILVCLLAGTSVMPGSCCVVFCVMAMSQPLVKMSYC